MTELLKRNIGIKGIIIVLLTLALLVPTLMINNLVSERRQRQEEAFTEISSKWAEEQTISGPIVSIPYYQYMKDTSGKIHKMKEYYHILPDYLKIKGNVNPEKRYRGIYEIVVYNSKITISGSFSNLSLDNTGIQKENMLLDQAFVSIGISDLRGIEESVSLKWDEEKYSFNSGIETNDVLKSGMNAPVKIVSDSISSKVQFSVDLNLKGSQFIHFTPIGKETEVSINSDWNTPSFDGAFLPDKREINSKGFSAYWKVLHLNRNYPQRWEGSRFNLDDSSFGINLILSMDNYLKTDRTIKYAILFIGLTFLIFFFLELLNNKKIHPLQYILIGFALCIFYVLLLSISEHLNFNIAYFIAMVMTISLISWYARSILGEKKLSGLVAGNLIILYGFIFTIIQLEDFALLMGSIGLFIILCVVMYYSRKIDWNQLSM